MAVAELTPRIDTALQAEAEDAVPEIALFDAEVAALAEHRSWREGVAGVGAAESASSSQIEGVTAGARVLAMAAIDAKAGPNAQLVTANVTAMQRAVAWADDISVDTILAAHRVLLDGHAYAEPGRLRDQQVWTGAPRSCPPRRQFVGTAYRRSSASPTPLRPGTLILTPASRHSLRKETATGRSAGNFRHQRRRTVRGAQVIQPVRLAPQWPSPWALMELAAWLPHGSPRGAPSRTGIGACLRRTEEWLRSRCSCPGPGTVRESRDAVTEDVPPASSRLHLPPPSQRAGEITSQRSSLGPGTGSLPHQGAGPGKAAAECRAAEDGEEPQGGRDELRQT